MLYTTFFWSIVVVVVVDCCTLVILEDSRKNGGWIVKPDYSISGIFGVGILVCMYMNLSLLLINKISFCMMGGITCSLCNIIILCLVFLFTTFIFFCVWWFAGLLGGKNSQSYERKINFHIYHVFIYSYHRY